MGSGSATLEGLDIPCVAPKSPGEWTTTMRIAAEADLRVVPIGRGSKSGWCRPAERTDLFLSTARDAGVVSYEPGDGTVSARAGTTMADLSAAVREGNHHLTPDVPRPDAATLGGVVAAGQSGFDRLRYGPVRNSLLGARVLLADGRVTRTGGQLVKNVTGYDLHRLYCGSHGTLCVVLEASLRLHPLPEEHAVLQASFAGLAQALEAARGALAIAARHLAVWCQDQDDGTWRVSVALCGRSEVVEDEAGIIAGTLPGCENLRGDAARAHIAEARDQLVEGGWPTIELTARRSQLQHALELVGTRPATSA